MAAVAEGGGAEGSKVNSVVVTTSFGLVSPIGGWKVGWSEGGSYQSLSKLLYLTAPQLP